MKIKLVTLLIGLLAFSCQQKDTTCGQAFFGGEIINANNDHLVLYDRSDEPLDTIYLDSKNRFAYKLDNLEPGLHSFVHGGETQSLILEENDSVLIRLNTLDFDESLVFTGKGAKKNNFLIELFIGFEKEDKHMYDLNKSKPESFSITIDSLKQNKVALLTEFEQSHLCSPLFLKVANASINYNYYAHYERYPMFHFETYDVKNIGTLPEDFYQFRNDINYNDEDLKHFYTYYNFLFPHINNLAANAFVKKNEERALDRYNVEFNLIKLALIDSLIGNSAIKNNMLKYTAQNFLAYNNSRGESNRVYEDFHAKSDDEEHKEHINRLYNNLKKLLPGNPFPEIEVLDHRNKLHNLRSLIDKPTVIYFWSKAIKGHFEKSHERVNTLRNQYPDLDFISVNINPNTSKVWRRLLAQHKFPLENEYRFMHPEAAKKILAIHYINKVMVIDADKNIITSNAYMFNPEFKELLAQVAQGTYNKIKL